MYVISLKFCIDKDNLSWQECFAFSTSSHKSIISFTGFHMGLHWKLQDIKDLYLGMYRVILKCVQMTVSNFFKLQRRIYPQSIFFFWIQWGILRFQVTISCFRKHEIVGLYEALWNPRLWDRIAVIIIVLHVGAIGMMAVWLTSLSSPMC